MYQVALICLKENKKNEDQIWVTTNPIVYIDLKNVRQGRTNKHEAGRIRSYLNLIFILFLNCCPPSDILGYLIHKDGMIFLKVWENQAGLSRAKFETATMISTISTILRLYSIEGNLRFGQFSMLVWSPKL